MKYILFGIAVWFTIGYGIAFIKAWFWNLVFRWNKKRASRDDQWMYE